MASSPGASALLQIETSCLRQLLLPWLLVAIVVTTGQRTFQSVCFALNGITTSLLYLNLAMHGHGFCPRRPLWCCLAFWTIEASSIHPETWRYTCAHASKGWQAAERAIPMALVPLGQQMGCSKVFRGLHTSAGALLGSSWTFDLCVCSGFGQAAHAKATMASSSVASLARKAAIFQGQRLSRQIQRSPQYRASFVHSFRVDRTQ